MTYLPDLRDQLVTAAAREAAPAVAPDAARRRRLPSLGGLATALASAGAIAVAVAALVLIPHGHGGGPSAGVGQTPIAAQARSAAQKLLAEVKVPPGAVLTGLRAGVPADLWQPSDRLQVTHRVGVHRVWRVPGRPHQVIAFVTEHRPPGFRYDGTSSAGSGPPGGPEVIQMENVVMYPHSVPGTRIWREVAVAADALKGGGTALRVDAEAGWLGPRTPAEMIPAGMTRASVTAARIFGPNRQRRTTVTVTDPAVLGALRLDLNDLAPTGQLRFGDCNVRGGVGVRYRFYRAGSVTPVATAIWFTNCDYVQLTLMRGGQPQSLASTAAVRALARHTAGIPGLAAWLRRR